MKVTAKNLSSLPDGSHPVGPNLFLKVRGRSKIFIFRYSLNGKRKDKSLGSISNLTISQAKAQVEKFRVGLREGKLPLSAKDELEAQVEKAANTEKADKHNEPVFSDYAARIIEKISSIRMWKNAKHRAQWLSTIETYAFPVIGEKRLSEIGIQDMLNILNPIWLSKNETASRLRGRLENVFSYAITDGLMSYNPALWRGNLDRELPPSSKVQKGTHHAAMTLKQLQENIGLFYPADTRSKQEILFTILTASRVGESIPAKWEEFDFANRIWSVPPERRKDGGLEPHRVPLSRQVIALLNSIERKAEYVFAVGDTLGSRYSLGRILKKKSGLHVTMHGFRSTFRDWAAENGVPDVVAEKCLMHATGGAVFQAYQRSDLLDQRRGVMQRWADAVFAEIK